MTTGVEENGQENIEMPPRAIDLSGFMFCGEFVTDAGDTLPGLLDYYGFESITLTEDS